MHTPPPHGTPEGHALPHEPQFAGSAWRSAQSFEQMESADAHWQVPPAQIRFPWHALPHVPQLLVSTIKSVQPSEQTVRSLGQTHCAPLHVSLAGQ
jgi:hypothetical protein